MTTTTRTGAIYGIGVYGTSRYGITGVILVPDGVQAVGTTDSGVNITADSNHTVVSIVGYGLVGSIGADQVIGDANVPVVGVVCTGVVGDNLTFSLGHTEDATGVQATGNTSAPTVVAKALVNAVGVAGVGATTTAIIVAEANVSVTGVEGTSLVNGNVTFKLDYKAVVGSVQGTGDTSAPTVVAKALIEPSSESALGVVGIATIVANAVTDLTGVEGTAQLGTPTQKTVNRVPVDGIEATGEVGTLTVVAKAVTNLTGVSATGFCGTVNAQAYSLYIVSGVEATGSSGDVTIRENARPTFDGVQAIGYVGTSTVTVTVFDYNAVRDLYAATRTVYVDRRSTSRDRTVLVPVSNRTVLVEASQSSHRVVYINAQPRVVTVARRSTSDDREVLAA